MKNSITLTHPFEPFYDAESEILILGSFPSVKSREYGFYYAHPQNRFWKVLSKVYNEPIKDDINSKKTFLKKHHIALFDVCKVCDIKGSSDLSIKNVIPNDITSIINNSKIHHIFVNGKTAYNLYNKLIKNKTHQEATYLPSTSPLNARFNLESLTEKYLSLKK